MARASMGHFLFSFGITTFGECGHMFEDWLNGVDIILKDLFLLGPTTLY
jgi:hypothetical protein